MGQYTFRFMLGQSAPWKTIEADSDEVAYKHINAFLATCGGVLIANSIIYRKREPRKVADPRKQKVHIPD